MKESGFIKIRKVISIMSNFGFLVICNERIRIYQNKKS